MADPKRIKIYSSGFDENFGNVSYSFQEDFDNKLNQVFRVDLQLVIILKS